MKKLITILETCSQGTAHYAADYNLLPESVKSAVDQALLCEDKAIEVDIYKQALQYLWDYESKNSVDCEIRSGEVVENMGFVELYQMD